MKKQLKFSKKNDPTEGTRADKREDLKASGLKKTSNKSKKKK